MIFKESKYIEENKCLHLKYVDGKHNKSKDNVLQDGDCKRSPWKGSALRSLHMINSFK